MKICIEEKDTTVSVPHFYKNFSNKNGDISFFSVSISVLIKEDIPLPCKLPELVITKSIFLPPAVALIPGVNGGKVSALNKGQSLLCRFIPTFSVYHGIPRG